MMFDIGAPRRWDMGSQFLYDISSDSLYTASYYFK